MFHKVIAACAAIIGASFMVSANATVWYHENNGPGSSSAGDLNFYSAQFNDQTNSLSFELNVDYSNVGAGNEMNMGWVAMNAGGSPNSNNRIAQMVMDFTTGDLLVYEYQNFGFPNASRHIQTFSNALNITDNGTVLNIQLNDLDVTSIINGDPQNDAATWAGVGFDDNIGIWAHMYNMPEFSTDGTVVTGWNRNNPRTGMDIHNTTANPVSEPAGLALIGMMGLIGFAAYRRRKAA